jgi:allantoinase
MDHDRYTWSALFQRRLMAVLDRLGVRATAVVNAAVAERCPFLIEEIGRRHWEVAAYGRHMGEAHDTALGRSAEAALIDESLYVLRQLTGQAVRGWLSPGGTETRSTLDLLAERGVSYVLDWANDELPYPLRTATGRLHAMPGGHELSDATIVWERRHTAAEFAEAMIDQFEVLDRETERHGGRILTVALHGWISGQPHRIGAVERALGHVIGRRGVWPATASEILAAFTDQESSA